MKDRNDDKKISIKETKQVYQEKMIYNIQFNSINIIFSINIHI